MSTGGPSRRGLGTRDEDFFGKIRKPIVNNVIIALFRTKDYPESGRTH